MMASKLRTKLSIALVAAQAAAVVTVLAAPAHAGGLAPSEWVIGPHHRVVLITLDGRPSPRHLRGILHMLEKKNARASFFLPGSYVAGHRKQVRTLHRAGMAVGNRGYGPWAFSRMTDAHIARSIRRAQKALKAAGVSSRPFARPPKGERGPRVLRDLAALGYRSVRWTEHPGGGPARFVRRFVMRKVHDGSIISLDLWRRGHRKALPKIIHRLRARNFRLVTLNALHHVHPVNWAHTLQAGSSGRAVKTLERILRRTSFPAGPIDGTFGYEDEQAVIAFEKLHRLARDAVVPPQEMERIATSRRPAPPRRHLRHYIDVDISRQVLFEVRHHRVFRTLPVSTGGEYTYSTGNGTAVAHTPRGSFSIIRKRTGWDVGSLGALWYPNYFIGGFAIHGYPEVPTYPASHGCIRIPMYAAQPFFYREPLGVPVFVHN